MNTSLSINSTISLNQTEERHARLRDVSIKLEATFLAEMLKSAGLGETPTAFGGGAGEDQYQSFLIEAQALAMAEAGGIGLANQIFHDLLRRSNND